MLKIKPFEPWTKSIKYAQRRDRERKKEKEREREGKREGHQVWMKTACFSNFDVCMWIARTTIYTLCSHRQNISDIAMVWNVYSVFHIPSISLSRSLPCCCLFVILFVLVLALALTLLSAISWIFMSNQSVFLFFSGLNKNIRSIMQCFMICTIYQHSDWFIFG